MSILLIRSFRSFCKRKILSFDKWQLVSSKPKFSSNIEMENNHLNPPSVVTEKMAVRTAGIIIIGDEILKGQVADTNSHFMSQRLHAIGIKLCRVSVIADSITMIAREVSHFARNFNMVFTSGGVGPTHDDLTYEGVALAFGDKVAPNEKLVEFWKDYYPHDEKAREALMKMTQVPTKAQLIHPKIPMKVISKGTFPIVVVKNVYIFPGVPKYLRAAFQAIEKTHLQTKLVQFHTKEVFLNVAESVAVEGLNATVDTFRESVDIGSYPIFDNCMYKTKISIESTDQDETQKAYDFLISNLRREWIVEHGGLLGDAVKNMKYLIEMKNLQDFTKTLQDSIEIITDCYSAYKEKEVFISFNGGKDCTALMHLVFTVLLKKNNGRLPDNISAVYFRCDKPFPEVESFIMESSERYKLNLIIKKAPIKSALVELVEEHPEWKAVLMGTRRSDPFSNGLKNFQQTDEGWPKLMRVNPLLDWSYQNVWNFLRELSIPYCSLYDQGYTSLGHSGNTKPNPSLLYVDENGEQKYRPAYYLENPEAERHGRHHRVSESESHADDKLNPGGSSK